MMDNDSFNDLTINDDSIHDTITAIQKKSGNYKGSRIKGKDQKDLINEIKLFPCNRVSIIGGEPLLDHRRAFLETLFTELRSLGYEVSVKTNGSQDISWVKKEFPEVIVIGGWKCPVISGERANKSMLESNLGLYEKTDALRFMVSRDDLKEVEKVLKSHPEIKAQVFLTPVWDTIDSSEVADWIVKHLEFNIRLSSRF